MSTTPTLYVIDSMDYTIGGDGKSYFRPKKATHDELIAAMPRCKTCGSRTPELATYDPSIIVYYYCPYFDKVDDEFGCVEHTEEIK